MGCLTVTPLIIPGDIRYSFWTVLKNVVLGKMVNARFSDLIRRWGAHISFSLVDQALFSGANFLLNILLARWLLPEAYGAFAVAFRSSCSWRVSIVR